MTEADRTDHVEPTMPITHRSSVDGSTSGADLAASGGHQMDSRIMGVMMIGCCVAVPLALIIGGAGVGSLSGASPWLVGVGAALAIALVIVHRTMAGPVRGSPPDRHR